MALDPSFRSRLREALHQSVVGRPSRNPGDAASDPESGDGAARPVVEFTYEAEEDRQCRVDAQQSAWIADTLGGWWNRGEGGLCLVVDRMYAADRVHGDCEIGRYAETLARYRGTLRTFSFPGPPTSEPSLFRDLDGGDDEQARVTSDVPRPTTSSAGAVSATSDCALLASAVGPRTSDDERLVFFDLETTGLSGGAGTCAFLMGYGWFEGEGFRTRQFFLSGYGHEAAMLRLAADPLGRPAPSPLKSLSSRGLPAVEAPESACARQVTLVSFNGKTFDVPLIGGRYLFHRLASPFDDLPHIDLLHPARRLWRHRPGVERVVDRDRRDAFAQYFRMTRSTGAQFRTAETGRTRDDLAASVASCALGALEHAVLGFRRIADVPGADIPTRYFHYARTGDARPLGPVLEHNRLDLVSLAALASVVARMLEEGPQAARNAHECLALGRLYERSGAVDRATACYEKAVEGDPGPAWRADTTVEREALRRLAMRHRRERRYEEAAAAWQRLLELSSGQAAIDFEALHALAVHHEHRSKDLNAARALVMRAIEGARDGRSGEALRHRLARIERKLTGGGAKAQGLGLKA